MKKHYLVFLLFFGMAATHGALAQDTYVAQWAQTIGYPQGATLRGFISASAVDASGNLYTSGTFHGTVAFGTFTLASTSAASNVSYDDIFVAKQDANGNYLWASKAGGSSGDRGIDLALDASANVYVTGFFFSSDAHFGATLLNAGNGGAFVAKLDGATGNFLWATQEGIPNNTNNNFNQGIAVDGSGNVYTVGSMTQAVVGGGSATGFFGGFTLTSSNGYLYIAKQNTNGVYQWATQTCKGGLTGATGVTFTQGYHAISSDASGNLYVTGGFEGTSTFGSAATLVSAGSQDAFVAKLNTGGTFQWAVKGGGTGDDIGHGITLDGSGNVFVTGQFGSTSAIATATFGATTLTSAGSYDIFTAKLSTSGVFQWAKSAGGTSDDAGFAVALDASGNVYTTGFVSGPASFGAITTPGPTATPTATGGVLYSRFLAKQDGSGAYLTAVRVHNGSTTNSNNDAVADLATSGSAVYVVGDCVYPYTGNSPLFIVDGISFPGIIYPTSLPTFGYVARLLPANLVGGTVYDDGDGGSIGGTGTSGGGLYVVPTTAAGGVVPAYPYADSSVTVAGNGAFSYYAVDGSVALLSTGSSQSVGYGNMLTTASLNTGWATTNDGTGVAGDGVADSKVSMATAKGTTLYYGIDSLPLSAPHVQALASQPATGSYVAVDALTGSDHEDQPATGSLSGKDVVITAKADNGTLVYNGAPVNNGDTIRGYAPSSLQLLVSGSGYSQSTFSFRYIDRADKASIDTATQTISFPSAVLPVTWASFTGSANGCTATLNWQTGTESNGKYFAVEAGTDGVDFRQVGQVASKNSATGSSYDYLYALANGTYYFRIKAVDLDGKFTYSPIVQATGTGACGSGPMVQVSPNPTGDIFYIQGLAANSHISVMTLGGQKLTEVISGGTGQSVSLGSYANGVYIVRIQSADGTTTNVRVVKK